jgi:GWxTD domain-containing protein
MNPLPSKVCLKVPLLAFFTCIFLGISFGNQAQQLDFQLKNLSTPTKHFARVSDTLVIESNSLSQVFLVKFNTNFEPAAPPMIIEGSIKSAALNVIKVSKIPTNQPLMIDEGLYLIQQDTSTGVGIGLKVTPKDFPKYKKINNLINTMVYISTSGEMGSFLATEDKRVVFDNFWLNLGGNVENAQRMLKLYFQRVKEANQQFTNYKEGWKTDMGIIHIIFGTPDNIIENAENIKWEYFSSPNRPKVAFDFVKKSNIFTGYHYELQRSPLHKDAWYDTVKKWRGGEIK